jgi:hypothetical protein
MASTKCGNHAVVTQQGSHIYPGATPAPLLPHPHVRSASLEGLNVTLSGWLLFAYMAMMSQTSWPASPALQHTSPRHPKLVFDACLSRAHARRCT